ncbi:MAG: TetR/AcrR family transcriptional regulator [Chloroflexi bacterium]|nr:MAG: TetR/AcrR family transcriptional regulator [Chloroflexota bacterium]
MPARRSASDDLRARLVDTAVRRLEESGPEALRARQLTAEVGTSTQAVYTLFGGMAGLFREIVREGFIRFDRHVAEVPATDDPVSDCFAQGMAYRGWALRHPQLYRLMFGLTGGDRVHAEWDMTGAGTVSRFPEAQVAFDRLVRAVDRMREAGRIGPVDPVAATGQIWSATHGYVLLEIAGFFGHPDTESYATKPVLSRGR